jgi:hypothetical protein
VAPSLERPAVEPPGRQPPRSPAGGTFDGGSSTVSSNAGHCFSAARVALAMKRSWSRAARSLRRRDEAHARQGWRERRRDRSAHDDASGG